MKLHTYFDHGRFEEDNILFQFIVVNQASVDIYFIR